MTAGTTYELASGSTYTGTLNITADNVTVQNSGPGRWPVITRQSYGSDIKISGNGDIVRRLRITGRGYAGKNGYIVGVSVSGQNAVITDVSLYGNLYAGVYFERSASGGIVSHSVINHCDALNPADLGSGAFGVLLWGDHNTVEDNILKNQVAASPVYGRDGSGVEVYHGRYNVIKDNAGSNDVAFTELGGAGATGNSYIGNTFDGRGDFLITRGSGDRMNGPAVNTIMIANHVEGEIVSYSWQPYDGTLLTLRDNIVSVPGGTALWTDGGYLNGGGNKLTGKVITRSGVGARPPVSHW